MFSDRYVKLYYVQDKVLCITVICSLRCSSKSLSQDYEDMIETISCDCDYTYFFYIIIIIMEPVDVVRLAKYNIL